MRNYDVFFIVSLNKVSNKQSICRWYNLRCYWCHSHDIAVMCFAIPVKLPWIFPGAPLTCNGAPGNIQGYLDRYDLLFAVRCYMDTAMKRSHSYHSIPVKLPWIFPGAPLKVNGTPGISRVTWQVSNRYLLAHPRPLLIYQEDTMLLVYRDSHYKPEMMIRPL